MLYLRVLATSALAVVLLAVPAVEGYAADYRVVDLGAGFSPMDVGNDGSVIGGQMTSTGRPILGRWRAGAFSGFNVVPNPSYGFERAEFVYSVWRLIPFRGVADDGSIVGSFAPPGAPLSAFEGARLAGDGMIHPLPPLPGYTSSLPIAINASGSVVGSVFRAGAAPGTFESVPVRWDDGQPTRLAEPPDRPSCGVSPCSTLPIAISDGGAIIGVNQSFNGVLAVEWSRGGSPSIMPGIHPNGTSTVYGTRADDIGGDVAIGLTRDGAVGAVWRDGFVQGATSPFVTPGDPCMASPFAIPKDVNENEEIVGIAAGPCGEVLPYVQRGTHVVNLNDRLPAGSGWTLSTAQAISGQGWIVGRGALDGVNHGYLLIPDGVPEISFLTPGEDAALDRRAPAGDPGLRLTFRVDSERMLEAVCFRVQTNPSPAPRTAQCTNATGPTTAPFTYSTDLRALIDNGTLVDGPNEVRVWAWDSDGVLASEALTVRLDHLVGQFEGRPTGLDGELELDATGSSGGLGEVVAYTWDFGDGSSAVTSGPSVTHAWPPGTSHRVKLTVTNELGHSSDPVERAVFAPKLLRVKYMTFIPSNYIDGPPVPHPSLSCLRPVPTEPAGYQSLTVIGGGDNRSFDPESSSYRTLQYVELLEYADDLGRHQLRVVAGSARSDSGISTSYVKDGWERPEPADGPLPLGALNHGVLGLIDPSDDDGVLQDCALKQDAHQGTTNNLRPPSTRVVGDRLQVTLKGSARNGLVALSPTIDWNWTVEFRLLRDAAGSLQVMTFGDRDAFPAYEIYVNELPVYQWAPHGAPASGLPVVSYGPLDLQGLLSFFHEFDARTCTIDATGILCF